MATTPVVPAAPTGMMNPNAAIETQLAAGVSITKETPVNTKGTLPGSAVSGGNKLNVTMQLFGLPHQFLEATDQRNPAVSSIVGRKFVENIILDSTIVSIIPGKPKYLPGVRDKEGVTNAFFSAMENGTFADLRAITGGTDEEIRLYDFESAYNEYFGYANMLCRICAGYLELTSGLSGSYRINGSSANFLYQDWKHYKWNGQSYSNIFARAAGKWKKGGGEAIDFSDNSVGKTSKELSEAEQGLLGQNYLQFYVDTGASSGSQSLSNNTQPSMFKSAMDQGSQGMRDLTFLAGAGGVDTDGLTKLGESAMDAINKVLTGGDGVADSTAGSVMSRLLSTGKSVIKGENVMMPDIWAGSSNSKSFNITLNFKAAYGNRLTNYVEVIVPTMLCIALAYPRGTTANSYGSPPLVKVYKRGEFSCSLGIVSSIEIHTENPDGFSVDNTPMEVTVNLGITDLYSDMALTPPGDPILFVSNTSLVDFLATTCGLDLLVPDLKKKVSSMWNMAASNVRSIPSTMLNNISESFDRLISAYCML